MFRAPSEINIPGNSSSEMSCVAWRIKIAFLEFIFTLVNATIFFLSDYPGVCTTHKPSDIQKRKMPTINVFGTGASLQAAIWTACSMAFLLFGNSLACFNWRLWLTESRIWPGRLLGNYRKWRLPPYNGKSKWQFNRYYCVNIQFGVFCRVLGELRDRGYVGSATQHVVCNGLGYCELIGPVIKGLTHQWFRLVLPCSARHMQFHIWWLVDSWRVLELVLKRRRCPCIRQS